MQIFNGNCGFGKIWLKLLKTSWNRNALGNLQKRLLQCCSDSMNKCLIQVLFKHHPQNSTKMTDEHHISLPSPPKKIPEGFIGFISLPNGFFGFFLERCFGLEVSNTDIKVSDFGLAKFITELGAGWHFLLVYRYCFFWFRNPKNHQVRLVVHPIIYRFFFYCTSQVVQDFWTIKSMWYV